VVVWKDSGLQIISAIIGSSLVVTALTALFSQINQPSIYLDVRPHLNLTSNNGTSPPKVQYYEVVVRNDGRSLASNMTVSTFVTGKIHDFNPILHGEQLVVQKNESRQGQSLVPVHIPRLAKDAVVVFRVTPENSSIVDPYYVSATYDQGSVQYPNFNIRDVEQGRFPDILTGRGDIYGQVLIISSALSFLFFFVAIIHRRIREIAERGLNSNLLWVIPAAILICIFLLFVCEELPRFLLRTSGILIPPVDVRFGLSYDTIVPGTQYTQGTLIASAFIFCGISWLARWLIGYLLAKEIIMKSQGSVTLLGNLRPKPIVVAGENWMLRKIVKGKKFLLYSLVLIGIPIESFIILFFGQSIYNFSASSIFISFLLVDITLYLTLIFVAPKSTIVDKRHLYYGLLGISIVGALSNFVIFIMLTKLPVSTYDPAFNYVLFFSEIVFVLQVVRSIIIGILHRKLREQDQSHLKKYKIFHFPASGLSLILVASWIVLLAYVTSAQSTILQLVPIVLIGVVTIVLEFSYLVLTYIIQKKSSGQP
jgi:hypothetical protein